MVNVLYLQVDPRRTCDIRSRRHLPQPSASHAWSPRCCVVPWASIRIQDLSPSIPHFSNPSIAQRCSVRYHPSLVPFLSRRTLRRMDSSSSGNLCHCVYTSNFRCDYTRNTRWACAQTSMDMQIRYSPRTTFPHTRFRVFSQLHSRFD